MGHSPSLYDRDPWDFETRCKTKTVHTTPGSRRPDPTGYGTPGLGPREGVPLPRLGRLTTLESRVGLDAHVPGVVAPLTEDPEVWVETSTLPRKRGRGGGAGGGRGRGNPPRRGWGVAPSTPTEVETSSRIVMVPGGETRSGSGRTDRPGGFVILPHQRLFRLSFVGLL